MPRSVQQIHRGHKDRAARHRIDMGPSILAQKLLDWEDARRELDRMEREIKTAVLAMEKTQVVGNVRATYSKGRRTYDYEGRCAEISSVDEKSAQQVEVVIAKHTVPKTDWNKACKELELDDIPYTQSEPSVTLKLEG